MKRILALAMAAALLVPGLALAKSPGTDHHPKAALAVGAAADSARPGKEMHVVAVVISRKGALGALSGTAVVHFTSGDVTVTLLTGKGFDPAHRMAALHASVLVPAGEPRGQVGIDVTVTRGTDTATAHTQGHVLRASKPKPSPAPPADPKSSPKPSHNPEPSESPEPSRSPEPTPSDGPTPTPPDFQN